MKAWRRRADWQRAFPVLAVLAAIAACFAISSYHTWQGWQGIGPGPRRSGRQQSLMPALMWRPPWRPGTSSSCRGSSPSAKGVGRRWS